MVRIDAVTDDDCLEYSEIFKIADGLFGWTREDSYKVILEDKVYMLFGFHPIFMLFGYDKHGKLVNKSCVVNEEGKVVSITLDGYQVNVYDDMIYLIDEHGKHQSVQMMKNCESPNFEVSANGLISYMQYDSKKNVRMVIKYDQNVCGEKGRIYGDYFGEPFYISVESNPIKRDKGLFFLGSKSAYYRMDFDVWNNKWQYDLATIGEYGFGAVMTSDTISLHGGEKEFSRYYRELLSVGDYFSLTTFPLGKAYKKNDIDLIANTLSFNSYIPAYVVDLFNNRNVITEEFQCIIDSLNNNKKLK